MYCKSCGKEIQEGTRFCQYCGTKVQQIVVQNRSVANQTRPVSAQSFKSNSSVSSNKANKVIIILSLIIILLFIVLFVGLLTRHPNQTGDESTYDEQEILADEIGEDAEYAWKDDSTGSLEVIEEVEEIESSGVQQTKLSYTADELPSGTYVMQGEEFVSLESLKPYHRNQEINENGYKQFGDDYVWMNANEDSNSYFKTVTRGSVIAFKGEGFSEGTPFSIIRGESGLTFRYSYWGGQMVDLMQQDTPKTVSYVNGEEIDLYSYAKREGWSDIEVYPGMNSYHIFLGDFKVGDACKLGNFEGTNFVEYDNIVNIWIAVFQSYSEANTKYTLDTQTTPNGYFTVQLPNDMPQGIYEMQSPASFFPIYVFVE